MRNFLLERKVKDEEITKLESFIKSNPDSRKLRRGLAVKMAIQKRLSRNQYFGVTSISI